MMKSQIELMTKSMTTAFFTLILAVGMLNAQTASPKKSVTHTASAAATPQAAQRKAALPTTEEIQTSMKRTFGYDPGVSWQILDIRESSIPGLAEVLVSMNKQQPVHLYLAPG